MDVTFTRNVDGLNFCMKQLMRLVYDNKTRLGGFCMTICVYAPVHTILAKSGEVIPHLV